MVDPDNKEKINELNEKITVIGQRLKESQILNNSKNLIKKII